MVTLRDRAQRERSSLAKRAFERALPSERLVTGPARGATLGEWADLAARNACQADGGAEIEQSLRAGCVELLPGSLLYATDVRVDRQDLPSEREVRDRGCGVGADTGQLRQVLGPAVLRNVRSRPGAG